MKIIHVAICVSLCDLAPIQPSRLIAQHKFSFCVPVLPLQRMSPALPGIQDPPVHASDLRQLSFFRNEVSDYLFLTLHQIPTLGTYIDSPLQCSLHYTHQCCPLIQHVIV